MNRRNFLSLFSAGIAGIALEQAIPLGRVWSFPSKIAVLKPGDIISIASINRINPLFEIGDIVSIPAFSALRFVVTDMGESDGTIYLADSRGRQAGIVAPSARKALQSHYCGLPPG